MSGRVLILSVVVSKNVLFFIYVVNYYNYIMGKNSKGKKGDKKEVKPREGKSVAAAKRYYDSQQPKPRRKTQHSKKYGL